MTPEEVITKLERNGYGNSLLTRRGMRYVAPKRPGKDARDLGIVASYRRGTPIKQLAYDYNVSTVTVYKALAKYGVPLRRSR
jgi:hypothetical protein